MREGYTPNLSRLLSSLEPTTPRLRRSSDGCLPSSTLTRSHLEIVESGSYSIAMHPTRTSASFLIFSEEGLESDIISSPKPNTATPGSTSLRQSSATATRSEPCKSRDQVAALEFLIFLPSTWHLAPATRHLVPGTSHLAVFRHPDDVHAAIHIQRFSRDRRTHRTRQENCG